MPTTNQMGITDKSHNSYDFAIVNSEINRIEDILESRKADSNMAIDTSEVTSNKKPKKSRLYKCYLDRTVRAAKKGIRQARRTENTKFLLSMSEADEPEDDIFSADLIDHGLTPFATLFVEQEKMKIWNDFINQSEDEQQRLLGERESCDPGSCDLEQETEIQGCDRQDSTGSWEHLQDNRSVHPAYSPKDCFQRIEHKLQAMLSRRHLPFGTLLALEEDVISFFVEWPHSVYVSRLETSFDRMLLHALCQYLGLDSSSFNDDKGVRQTQVENLQNEFVLPEMTLSNYIEYRSRVH